MKLQGSAHEVAPVALSSMSGVDGDPSDLGLAEAFSKGGASDDELPTLRAHNEGSSGVVGHPAIEEFPRYSLSRP